MKLLLSQFALGRALLHFGCLCRGGRFQFHLAGMIRAGKSILQKCFPRKLFVVFGKILSIHLAGLCLAFFGVFVNVNSARAQVEFVNPAMGGQGFMLEPTRPTVSLPNSMVRVYPVRKDQLDDQIRSFPLTIISHRLGELFWLMPSDGSSDAWNLPQAYDQEAETTSISRRNIRPNYKLTAAVIGTNGRGLAYVGCRTSLTGVEITHICNLDVHDADAMKRWQR